MTPFLEQIREGQRNWAAELLLRAGGLGLLAASYATASATRHIVTAAPAHSATISEFALSALVFGLLTSGLALVVQGPALFRLTPIPPRSAFLPRRPH